MDYTLFASDIKVFYWQKSYNISSLNNEYQIPILRGKSYSNLLEIFLCGATRSYPKDIDLGLSELYNDTSRSKIGLVVPLGATLRGLPSKKQF